MVDTLQNTPAPGAAARSIYFNLLPSPEVRRAFDSIFERERECNEELVRICEIPAPPFKEAARIEYIARRFSELGLSNIRVDSEGNVIAARAGRYEKPAGA